MAGAGAASADDRVSAVIDAHGRVIRSLGLNHAGVIDAQLPPPTTPTLYSVWGETGLALMLLVSGGGWFFGRRRSGDPTRLGMT
jgi:apolipoprotein N-acyltransferase